MISIRGATTIDEDTKDEVLSATSELLSSIIKKNNLELSSIISIIFTCTNDIKSVYPAVSARELGIVHAGLMCFNEMYVLDSLRKCIRVLLLVNREQSQKVVKHVYMKNAKILRPDLSNDD